MESSLDTLSKLGEQPLREISDNTLQTDMITMNEIMRNTSDDYIMNLKENKAKKVIITMKIWSNLYHILHFVKPSLLGDVSLKMVELTMSNGLVSLSPLALGYYGEVLVATGSVKEGCRMGRYNCLCSHFLDHQNLWLNHHILFSSTHLFTARLALKLVESKLSSVHKSAVFSIVYQLILWASDPLQSIIEAHEIGRRVG